MALAADVEQKLQKLVVCLHEMGSVAVAFSGGVDSTLLLKVAHDLLGERATAITVQTRFFPQREMLEAAAFCKYEGIRQLLCKIDELAIPGVRDNPPNRCYLCKQALFTQMQKLATANGFSCLAEGSNLDDDSDYRPGLKAIEELQVSSPLRLAQLTKAEIRAISRELKLPTAEKPSYACLASRFVYGEKITAEKLQMVERAEQFLFNKGFRQVRVRLHGQLARIEILPEEFPQLLVERVVIEQALRSYGFNFVALDLLGYSSGSMNTTLVTKDQQ